MILNLLVIAFILAMAYWWGSQGLFSALIHLICTLVAGALAFGLWEWLAVSYLLNTMPEFAWGVALIVPFALFLLLLRTPIDMLVPGNVQFPQIVNLIVGGALGAVAGGLTAGLVVIGFLFTAPVDMTYRPYQVQGDRISPDESLWIAVDRMAADVFAALNDNALASMLADQSFSDRHPHLLQSASMFRQVSRPHARSAISADHVQVTDYFLVSRDKQEANPALAEYGGRVHIVTTTITLKDESGDAGAADGDNIFTATRAQAPLIHTAAGGEPEFALPVGFVVLETFGDLTTEGFVRSEPVTRQQTLHWIYALPGGSDPHAFRLKQIYKPLPEQTRGPERIDQWLNEIDWEWTRPTEDADDRPDMGEHQGTHTPVEGMTVRVSNEIGGTINKNSMTGADFDENNAIRRAVGTYTLSRASPSLRIDRIARPQTTRIVQIEVTADRAGSLFGRAMEAAGALQPPELVRRDGRTYSAFGWMKWINSERVELSIDVNGTVRRIPPEIAQMPDNQRAVLFFLVPRGSELTEFRFGGASQQELNITAE